MQAAGNYAPCAVVMVPVMSVVPVSYDGTTYVPMQQGYYSPFQLVSALRPSLDHAPMHSLCVGHPYGQSGQLPAANLQLPTNTVANQLQDEQPCTEQRRHRLVNKKVAHSAGGPAIATTGLVTAETSSRANSKEVVEAEKKLMRKAWVALCCPGAGAAFSEDFDVNSFAQNASLKLQERILRLALLGWHKVNDAPSHSKADDPSWKTRSTIADFMSEKSTAITDRTCAFSDTFETESAFTERTPSSGFTSEAGTTLTERTHSTLSEAASYAESASLCEDTPGFGFLEALPTWDYLRVIRGVGSCSRIGVDLGGVIFLNRATRWVRNALHGVRGLVKTFGAENVFVVSRVELHGSMHNACQRELTKPRGFLEKSGLLPSNVVFVPAVDGPFGKGAVSARLGLTHFIDDRPGVLKSICADEAGNSGHLVKKFHGKLIHFEHGGMGTRRPSAHEEIPADFKHQYHPVSGWSEVLELFEETAVLDKPQPTPSVFTQSGVDVHRIPVEVHGEASLRIVATELLKGFTAIEDFAGVKILLRGKGSPHPQPKSEEQNPLSIVVRAKPHGSTALDSAVSLVEKLLRNVLRQLDASWQVP